MPDGSEFHTVGAATLKPHTLRHSIASLCFLLVLAVFHCLIYTCNFYACDISVLFACLFVFFVDEFS